MAEMIAVAPRVVAMAVFEIPRSWIVPMHNPATGRRLNNRTHFDPTELDELKKSVESHGIHEPLLVRIPEGATAPEDWTDEHHPLLELVAGERRFRAAELAGLDTVPCYLRVLTVAEALDICIVENVQRANLSPVEEARGFRDWLDLVPGRTQSMLAQRIGKDQTFVSNRLQLLRQPESVLALVEEGILGPTQVRDFFGPFTKIPQAAQDTLFADAVARIREAAAKPDAAITNDVVREQVGQAAAAISRPLDNNRRIYPADNAIMPAFDAALHAQCGCGGPVFRYIRYWDAPAVRCFDLAWWDAAQAAAAKAEKEERARAVRAQQAATGDAAPLTLTELQQKHGWGAVSVVATASGPAAGHRVLHPEALPLDSLLLVKQDYPTQLVLACVDRTITEAAEKRANAELAVLVRERRAARTEADRAAAAEPPKWADVVSLITDANIQNRSSFATGVRTEFGLKKGEDASRSLTAVLVLRRARGELAGYGDPFDGLVKQELQERYGPALRDLFQRAVARAELAAAEARAAKLAVTPPHERPDAFELEQVHAKAVEMRAVVDGHDGRGCGDIVITELGRGTAADADLRGIHVKLDRGGDLRRSRLEIFPAPADVPEPRWALTYPEMIELRDAGADAYAAEHGLRPLNDKVLAFCIGVAMYCDGYASGAISLGDEDRDFGTGLTDGFRWAQVRHTASTPVRTSRAGLATKRPAAELQTLDALLALRVLHIQEAVAAYEAACPEAESGLAMGNAEETRLFHPVQRRFNSLLDWARAYSVAITEEQIATLMRVANDFGLDIDAVEFLASVSRVWAGLVCKSCGFDEAGPLVDGLCGECHPASDAISVQDATCRVCGCTDSRACPAGCAWVEVDREAGTGLCSNPACVASLAADRELLAAARTHEEYAGLLHTPANDLNWAGAALRAPAYVLQAALLACVDADGKPVPGHAQRVKKIRGQLKKRGASEEFPRALEQLPDTAPALPFDMPIPVAEMPEFDDVIAPPPARAGGSGAGNRAA